MKYIKFTIANYRAITGPLVVDVNKHSLVPIIGINECGKTTILHAIFAFDFYNDALNDNGRHLRDTTNLYGTSSPPATVSAEIELTESDFVTALNDIDEANVSATVAKYRRKRKHLPPTIRITRSLVTKTYQIHESLFFDVILNNLLARELIRGLPYILFFDDFRDSVEETIEIMGSADDAPLTGWLSIVEQLFQQTDSNFSVFNLARLEERRRKTVLAKVKRHLNETLTKEWQNFRLDDSDALQISIDFFQESVPAAVAPPLSQDPKAAQPKGPPKSSPAPATKSFLKLEIIETDSNGDEHYFFIRDRSKGFFWFFNFVMKLEFNPKIISHASDSGAIYLLDEPGSYLHASAQSKLCQKLKQLSTKNTVIYCTHSHYLLDPEIIPLSSIKVAEKSGNGNVELVSIHDHKGSILERRSAFQPVIDALRIKPFLLDLSHQKVLIAEGIYDYYAIEMFKSGRNINVLPSVGADSVKFYISLMIAWRISYVALWDNDKEGRTQHGKAINVFGEDEAGGRFFVLPSAPGKDRILQDMFDGQDVRLIKKTLMLPSECSFEKMIAMLFHWPLRHEVLSAISKMTKDRFGELFAAIGLG